LLRGRVSTCTLRYFNRGKPVLLAAIVDIKNLTLSAHSNTRRDEMKLIVVKFDEMQCHRNQTLFIILGFMDFTH
jgi:hypothetical protein